jgi:NADPH-dependent curcumin reductase CurA
MNQLVNRQWRLLRRPTGMVSAADFGLHEEPVRRPADGELLVRTLYVSFDPAMRAFLNDRPSYVPPQPVGQVMRAGAIGQIAESRVAGYAAGEFLTGAFGWQEYANVPADQLRGVGKIVPRHPLPAYLGILGGTGLTGYFGLLEVGRPQPGDTVVISAAAGASGSSAAQIAKLKGLRTIGIAGGPEKCRWLIDELRLDGAIDYKSEDVGARLTALCPQGINVYFDNVGGRLLETAIAHMARRGRIVLCGMISVYNDAQPQPGPSNLFELVARSVRMEGFLGFDFADKFESARREMETWVDAGQLRNFADVQEGFENIPKTFLRIFTGANIGKQMLKIADPDE